MNKFYENKIKHYQIVNHYGGNPKKLPALHKEEEERIVDYDEDERFVHPADKYEEINDYIDSAIHYDNNNNIPLTLEYYEKAFKVNSKLTLNLLERKIENIEISEGLLIFAKRCINNYFVKKETNLGIKILELLFEIGNIDAGMYLAKLYSNDNLFKKNICKSLEIYQRIISQKDDEGISFPTHYHKALLKIYNIKNNIIYTYGEKSIKKYILKCLTGYEYITAKVKYLSEWRTSVRHKEIKIKPLEVSEINDYFSYNNDYEVMYNSVVKDGCLLKYASDNLKNEKKIVKLAVMHNGLALKYASDNLKKNKEIILEAVSKNGMILEHILNEIQNPKKVINERNTIISAVKSNGLALQFASDELRDDKIIVNIAVKQNGLALKYVSDRLKSRVKIIIKAVNQNGLALQYVPEYIKSRSIEITGIAIRNNIYAINYSTIKLNDLPRISYLIYNYNLELIKYADYEIKNNYDVILNCVKQNGLLLEFASENLKMNEDIVIAAIKQNLLAHKFIGSNFLYSTKFIFYLFFKQRNLIFLLKDYDHSYNENFNKVDEVYPISISNQYDNKFFSHLYSILLNINIINIPYELTEQIKKDIEINFSNLMDNRHTLYAKESLETKGINFIYAITDNYYIKTYFKLMMKCCLKVSNYYENSTDKNQALLNVKNFPILQQNEFYRYIGLIKILKDTVLSKSGLLKLLLKKICLVLNNEKKSKIIQNIIIKSAISKKMLNRKFRIIENSNYYNRISLN